MRKFRFYLRYISPDVVFIILIISLNGQMGEINQFMNIQGDYLY